MSNYGSQNRLYHGQSSASKGDLTGNYARSEVMHGGGNGYDPYQEGYNTYTFSKSSGGGMPSGAMMNGMMSGGTMSNGMVIKGGHTSTMMSSSGGGMSGGMGGGMASGMASGMSMSGGMGGGMASGMSMSGGMGGGMASGMAMSGGMGGGMAGGSRYGSIFLFILLVNLRFPHSHLLPVSLQQGNMMWPSLQGGGM